MLCAVLITGFPPSEELQGPIESWIETKRTQLAAVQPKPTKSTRASTNDADAIGTVVTACATWLPASIYRGAKLQGPSTDAVIAALESPFNPCVFGLGLDTAMRVQAVAYPHAQVPVILSFCADAMLALDALRTPNMWLDSTPDPILTEALCHRIDRGTYALANLPPDPTLPASVLLAYLSALVPALVPSSLIPSTIPASHGSLVRWLRPLGPVPRRVLLFLLSFLQLFCTAEARAATGVSVARLASVFAPILFGFQDPWDTAKVRSCQGVRSREVSFLTACLLHLNCTRVDPQYVPTHGQGPHLSRSTTIKTQEASPMGPQNRTNPTLNDRNRAPLTTRDDRRSAHPALNWMQHRDCPSTPVVPMTTTTIPTNPTPPTVRSTSSHSAAPALLVESATSEAESESVLGSATGTVAGEQWALSPPSVSAATTELTTVRETRPGRGSTGSTGMDYQLQSAAQSARTSQLILDGINGLPTLASALSNAGLLQELDDDGGGPPVESVSLPPASSNQYAPI